MEAEKTCRAGQPQTKRELVGLILQAEVELERLQFENVDEQNKAQKVSKTNRSTLRTHREDQNCTRITPPRTFPRQIGKPDSQNDGPGWWGQYASVPTDGYWKTYRSRMADQRQKSGSLTKIIDRVEWMREQLLTLQRELERMESGKPRQQIQEPATRLKIKQF